MYLWPLLHERGGNRLRRSNLQQHLYYKEHVYCQTTEFLLVAVFIVILNHITKTV